MTPINLALNHKIGLMLDNPVMPAAGCFGFGTEYSRLVEVEALGRSSSDRSPPGRARDRHRPAPCPYPPACCSTRGWLIPA